MENENPRIMYAGMWTFEEDPGDLMMEEKTLQFIKLPMEGRHGRKL